MEKKFINEHGLACSDVLSMKAAIINFGGEKGGNKETLERMR